MFSLFFPVFFRFLFDSFLFFHFSLPSLFSHPASSPAPPRLPGTSLLTLKKLHFKERFRVREEEEERSTKKEERRTRRQKQVPFHIRTTFFVNRVRGNPSLRSNKQDEARCLAGRMKEVLATCNVHKDRCHKYFGKATLSAHVNDSSRSVSCPSGR